MDYILENELIFFEILFREFGLVEFLRFIVIYIYTILRFFSGKEFIYSEIRFIF